MTDPAISARQLWLFPATPFRNSDGSALLKCSAFFGVLSPAISAVRIGVGIAFLLCVGDRKQS